jgi:hypothetical protein
MLHPTPQKGQIVVDVSAYFTFRSIGPTATPVASSEEKPSLTARLAVIAAPEIHKKFLRETFMKKPHLTSVI